MANIEVNIGKENFLFDHRRALYWPSKKALLLGDVHLGKYISFQKAGIPISADTCLNTLERFKALCHDYEVHTLHVLGDFFHDFHSLESPHLKFWLKFLRENKISFHFIYGNHDGFLRKIRAKMPGVQIYDREYIDNFCLIHDAKDKVKKNFFILSGHRHPCFSIRGTSDEIRLPALALSIQYNYAILPAFGTFTGGENLSRRDYDFIVAGENFVERI